MNTTNNMNGVKCAFDHETNDYVAWDCKTGQTLATGSTLSKTLHKCDLSGGKPIMVSSLSRQRINPRKQPYYGCPSMAGNAPHSALV